MREVEVTLKNGDAWITVADHMWRASEDNDNLYCECGLVQHADGSYSA